MDINISEENGCQVLALSGRMDALTVKAFDEAAADLAGRAGVKILVDLSQLEFISSAGLRGILNLAKAAGKNRIPLGFCCLTPMVNEVFTISNFQSIMKVFPDKAAALASL
ncbi:anti-sigma factor antagonist [Deltaproteobacteria bacterium Smac51]|nr:anti-sigma factor antagonist [Deltaproteobacteria bacterium Smac51]